MTDREFEKMLRDSQAIMTGSAAFGIPGAKDVDWIVRRVNLARAGYSRLDLAPDEKHGHNLHFRSYRHGRNNLIVAESAWFFNRWMQAHRRCMVERPRLKGRRIAIFRHYLYGAPLTENPTAAAAFK